MRWILIILLVSFIGLQYRLWVGPGSWAYIVSLEQKIAQQKQVNQHLRKRNSLLATEIHGLKNGLKSVEARARSELGLIKKGETFYLLVDKKQ